MGLMLGKIDETTMIIHDVFALPVEGTETRVNAHTQAYEYMSKFVNDKQHVHRLENAIGKFRGIFAICKKIAGNSVTRYSPQLIVCTLSWCLRE